MDGYGTRTFGRGRALMQVYAIRINADIVKIGIAKDTKKRLHALQKQIQKQRPDISLTLLHAEDIKSAWSNGNEFQDLLRAGAVERAAHKDLATKRLPDKWFAVNGLVNTRYLSPTEWFAAADIEAICAVKAGVIQPLLSVTRAPAGPDLRFEDLFEGTLTAFLMAQEDH